MSLFGRSSLAALILAGLFTLAAPVHPAAPRAVREIRYWTDRDHTRVVLDMSGEARYSVRVATDPYRIVVDIPGYRISPSVQTLNVHDGAIDQVRVNRMKTLAQIVVELPRQAAFTHFALKPAGGKRHRIVIDVSRTTAAPDISASNVSTPGKDAAQNVPLGGIPTSSKTQGGAVRRGGERIVIIDPGHGGGATGTISRSGIKEKVLNLKLARMLKAEIERRPGYRAILVRDGDYDVPWVRRVSLAREKSGDIFVSLHFNGNRNRKIRGLELYFLSLEASDENAAAVAERENLLAAAGADSADFNDDLKSILFDVSLANAMQASSMLADEVASVLRVDPPIPFRKVKQAPLIVLRGIAMPSILIEGGYLSSRREAAIISKESYLGWLAKSLAAGIVSFLEEHPQPETAAGS